METAINYLKMLQTIMRYGSSICPRGLDCKEVEDLQLVVDPCFPFLTYKMRNYDVSYFKKEMMWKLGANKYDRSIQDHAKLWKQVINPDQTYNSNYGQYWFGEQHGIWDVVTELLRDHDSRKAIIPMLNKSHMSPQTVDTVCTECVGFRLRPYMDGYKLNMSVHMRSSDVIFGLGTDVPTFSFLYRLVFGIVAEAIQIPMYFSEGRITITSMSSHVYARHYDMVILLLDHGITEYIEESMPRCMPGDAMRIIASRGNPNLLLNAGELGGWLCG